MPLSAHISPRATKLAGQYPYNVKAHSSSGKKLGLSFFVRPKFLSEVAYKMIKLHERLIMGGRKLWSTEFWTSSENELKIQYVTASCLPLSSANVVLVLSPYFKTFWGDLWRFLRVTTVFLPKMTENPKYRPNFFKYRRKHTKLGLWRANLKLYANIRKEVQKIIYFKHYCELFNFENRT